MASSGSTFSKMQREREKKERAAAKREARQNKSAADAPETSTDVSGEGDLSAGDLSSSQHGDGARLLATHPW